MCSLRQHIQNKGNHTDKVSLAPGKDNMQIEEAVHKKS